MSILEQYCMCLECDKEFKNKLNVAICPECLQKERENYNKGIQPKYQTVRILFEKESCQI